MINEHCNNPVSFVIEDAFKSGKLAVEDSNESAVTRMYSTFKFIIVFLYLQGFLTDLLNVHVRKKEVLWFPIVWVYFLVLPTV